MKDFIKRNKKKLILTALLIVTLSIVFIVLYPTAIKWIGKFPVVAYYKLTALEDMIKEKHIYASEADSPLLRAYQLYTDTDDDISDSELKHKVKDILKTDIDNYYTLANLVLKDYDRYSYLRTKEQYAAAFPDSESYSGLGISISDYGPFIYIGKVYENSSAGRAGLIKGDMIFSIDGVDIRNIDYDSTRKMIAAIGEEPVELGILRDGKRIFVSITSAPVVVPNVYWEIDGDIGILTITLFQEDSFKSDVDAAMKAFDKADIDKLIIDFRNNRGGYIDYAVYLINALTPDKDVTLFTQTKRSGDKVFTSDGKGEAFDQITVLVNGDTYSAAEICSGYLKDAGHELIGTTTYGKAVGLTTYEFFGDELTLATLLIKLPKTGDYNEVGVEPDKYIENKPVYHNKLTLISIDSVLNKNSASDLILQMETQLFELGYIDEDAADGTWDQVTDAACKSFTDMLGYDYLNQLTIEELTVLNTLTESLSQAIYIEDTQMIEAYKSLSKNTAFAA